MGTLSTTVSGKTCQAWTSNTPRGPISAAQDDANFPDGSRAAAKNYCRNPDSDPGVSTLGPWCYITDPFVRWEMCDVPYCGTSNVYSTLSISSHVRLDKYNKYINLETVSDNVPHVVNCAGRDIVHGTFDVLMYMDVR